MYKQLLSCRIMYNIACKLKSFNSLQEISCRNFRSLPLMYEETGTFKFKVRTLLLN